MLWKVKEAMTNNEIVHICTSQVRCVNSCLDCCRNGRDCFQTRETMPPLAVGIANVMDALPAMQAALRGVARAEVLELSAHAPSEQDEGRGVLLTITLVVVRRVPRRVSKSCRIRRHALIRLYDFRVDVFEAVLKAYVGILKGKGKR